MTNLVESFLGGVDSILAWMSSLLKTTTSSYCDLETADSPTVLVARDGSLASVIRINGLTTLLGEAEFEQLCQGVASSLQTALGRNGYEVQVVFNYEPEKAAEVIAGMYGPARATAERLHLDLDDLFKERVDYLARYCAEEDVFFVLWTRPQVLSAEQMKQAVKTKTKYIKENHVPPFSRTQFLMAAIPDLRNAHDSFVRATLNDLKRLTLDVRLLEVHEALYEVRMTVDPDFTDKTWTPILPGDKITPQDFQHYTGEVSDLLWPDLSHQLMPRDAENVDLRTTRIGDKIYSTSFIDLFPKDIKSFVTLFNRTLAANIPWRISFLIESGGLTALRLKATIASILSFTSAQNRLISDSAKLLDYIHVNTDDAVVRLQVAAVTWAPEGKIPLLRVRASELAKALEGWGNCDVSEVCGDAFGGVVSTMLAVSTSSVATASVSRLSDVTYMLPVTRPASPWQQGAVLFRSPDGKPWPFQPGSSVQTTWIDLIYARPGSGKSVLSNAVNLAVCLSGGIQRLPRISVIDIGPSSSGLISLLKEALPDHQKHMAAYHRLQMTQEYSINPFDTQLGVRRPMPQERAFLVNFITLLATPLGSARPYDGVPDLAGMVVDMLYKKLADDGNPYLYTPNVEPLIDGILDEMSFVKDQKTTWWEVTDALFAAGFIHEAMLAQRFAMPLIADAASICRDQAVEDLYGKIVVPTGESLINAFARMISSAVREYPILARVTHFDLGESRIVSLDLDEVAKSGGEAADRQTAVMYMLARYTLAKDFYLSLENVKDMPEQYQDYHGVRIREIREDPKRIIYDEFHRTAKAQSVRDQVIIDMREGRKWNVQVALISQSLDDFDSNMIEFATSVYIMDAGPTQTIEKAAKIFGLSETAQYALKTRVHGPTEEGSIFLAQFSTKSGLNTQLLMSTLGPVELWSFSTTVEDATVRNELYKRIGPKDARRVLAALFPSGSVKKLVERRLEALKSDRGVITDAVTKGVVAQLIDQIVSEYMKNPDIKRLPT
ncbi:MAG: type IV secretion protein IcmB [Gammaproteobacteria bacterium]|nr:type IV secretion protein IcmB [Gammaproteobacteria bacterium]